MIETDDCHKNIRKQEGQKMTMIQKNRKKISVLLIIVMTLLGTVNQSQASVVKTKECNTESIQQKKVKTEKLHVEMKDLSKTEKQYIREVQATAVTNGALAAEILNTFVDNTKVFEMGVDEVLDDYYEKKNKNKLEKRILRQFVSNVDSSADTLVEEYKAAAKERENKNLDYAAGKVIVQFKREATEEQICATIKNMKGKEYCILNDVEQHIDKTMSAQEKDKVYSMEALQDCRIVSVDIANRQTVELAIEEYGEYNIIETVEKDGICEAAGEVEYAPHARQAVQSDEAWKYLMDTWKGERIVPRVAVLDSGLDVYNPELANRYNKTLSADIRRIDPDTGDYMLLAKEAEKGIPTYSHYHGTWVASVIAAESGNNIGTSGLGSYNGYNLVELVAINAAKLCDDGIARMYTSDMIKGILYATAKGCHVINISYIGIGEVPDSLQKSIDTAYFQGTTIISSMGNAGAGYDSIYPGSASHVLAVGSSNAAGQKADHSNYGYMMDVLAPGEGINIVDGGGVVKVWYGTSFAAPIVAVEAALLYFLGITNVDHITYLIRNTSKDIYEPGWDILSGHGIIDMNKAVRQGAADMIEPAYDYDVDRYIFDYEFYATAYPDLAKILGYNKNALYRHWKNTGINEGRVASVVFSIGYYMKANPDIVFVYGDNPYAAYLHFVRNGVYEGRALSPVFSISCYSQNHPDLSGLDSYNLVRHFALFGVYEGRGKTNEGFDVRTYAFSLDLNSILYIGQNTWKLFFGDYVMKNL